VHWQVQGLLRRLLMVKRLYYATVLLALLWFELSCAQIRDRDDVRDEKAGNEHGYTFRAPTVLGGGAVEPDEPRLFAATSTVLRRIRVHIVYIGQRGEDAAESFDPFVARFLRSAHWRTLLEYGVDAGELIDSVYVSTSLFFAKGSIESGLIADASFEELARAQMPRSIGKPLPRVGADARLVDQAEGYIFFLPAGVNVSMGRRGTYTYSTCLDALGYHRFNGREPYAVIGSCPKGRSAFVISHELAEMATDPIVGQGFFSARDLARSGGEVADLCREQGAFEVDGFGVARFWSNRRSACEPGPERGVFE
jgi:hypothetical protein